MKPIYFIAVVCAAFFAFPIAARAGDEDKEIIGAKKSKVFHNHPNECAAAKKINDENKIKFASEKEARDQGRRHCKICLDLDKKGDLNSRVAERDKNKKPRRKPSDPPKADKSSVLQHEEAHFKRAMPDGTLHLDDGQRVCLWGVSWPVPGQPNHEEAISLLEQRIRGKGLAYGWDGESNGPTRDRFGRLRAYVLRDDLQKDVAIELLSKGLAWVDRDTQCGRAEVYLNFEEQAWQEGRGVWARLDGEGGKRDVLIGRGGWQYHPVGCSHQPLLTAPSKATINEAKARRLSPCDHYKSKANE